VSIARTLTWLLVIIAIISHPLVDAGSDSDDALEIGWKRILDKKFPWESVTHLGNKLTPTIGGFLISFPVARICAPHCTCCSVCCCSITP
jgi:hypothetical protein